MRGTPLETTRFHPLFAYESLSGLLGAAFLVFLFFRFRHRLASGSLLFIFFIWYGVVRFSLENLRINNWLVLGIPTAQIVSVAFILVGVTGLIWRNTRSKRGADDPGAARTAVEDAADLARDPDPARPAST